MRDKWFRNRSGFPKWLIPIFVIVQSAFTIFAISYGSAPFPPIYFALDVAVMLILFTKFLDIFVFGACLLPLLLGVWFSAVAFGALSSGTVPGNRLPFTRLERWFWNFQLPFMIEINAEATPIGRWTITQFEHKNPENEAGPFRMAHSAYENPQVLNAVVSWLEASSKRE